MSSAASKKRYQCAQQHRPVVELRGKIWVIRTQRALANINSPKEEATSIDELALGGKEERVSVEEDNKRIAKTM